MSTGVNRLPVERTCCPPAAASPGLDGAAELRQLVRRIADDDHDAFAHFFDLMSGPVSDRLRHETHDPHQAAAVFTGTFVEVWWLAGGHVDPDTDVMAWIDHVARRRVADSRAFARTTTDAPTPQTLIALWAQHAELELVGLLTRRRDGSTALTTKAAVERLRQQITILAEQFTEPR